MCVLSHINIELQYYIVIWFGIGTSVTQSSKFISSR